MKNLKLILLSSSLLLASGCEVIIPDVTFCSFKTDNPSRDGAVCATSLSHVVTEETEDQFLSKLPGSSDHAPAVCMTANDFTAYRTALDQACRALGKKCKKAVKDSIENLQEVSLSDN